MQLNYQTLSIYKFMPQIICKEYNKADHEYFIYKKPNHNIIAKMIDNCNCPGVNDYIKYVNPIHPLDKLK
jgi:hypothetical protein